MKKITLLGCLLFILSTTTAQVISIISGSLQSPPATSCNDVLYDVDYSRACGNAVFTGSSWGVNGNAINIGISYQIGPICTPIIVNLTETLNLGILPVGNYTVNIVGEVNGVAQSTLLSNFSVVSCCSANPLFSASATSVCVGDSVFFQNLSTGSSSQQWLEDNTLLSTSVNFGKVFNDPGVFDIKLITFATGCSDSVIAQITVLDPPVLSLGADTSYCAGESLILSISAMADSVRWSTNQTSQNITVSNPGNYWATIYSNGCSNSDTISVTVESLPSLNLGADTTLCLGETLTLNAAIAGGSYVWSDQSTASSLMVDTAGTFFVSVTNSAGCTASDTIVVGYIPLTNCGISLPEERTSLPLVLYPNPTQGKVKLRARAVNFDALELELMDASGRRWKGFDSQNFGEYLEIDLSQMDAGWYYLQCKEGHKTQTIPIVIQ